MAIRTTPVLYFWYLNLQTVANHIEELISPQAVKAHRNWISLKGHKKSDYKLKRIVLKIPWRLWLVSSLNMLSKVYTILPRYKCVPKIATIKSSVLIWGRVLWMVAEKGLPFSMHESEVEWLGLVANHTSSKFWICPLRRWCSSLWDLWPHGLKVLCDHRIFPSGTL